MISNHEQFFSEENGKSCPIHQQTPLPQKKTNKSYKSYRSYFFVPARELGFEAGVFGKTEKNLNFGLTNGKSVVNLSPIAPEGGDAGGCGAEKISKKIDF